MIMIRAWPKGTAFYSFVAGRKSLVLRQGATAKLSSDLVPNLAGHKTSAVASRLHMAISNRPLQYVPWGSPVAGCWGRPYI